MKSFSIVALSFSLYPIISAASSSSETNVLPTYSNSSQEVTHYDTSNQSEEGWIDITPGLLIYNGDQSGYQVEFDQENENLQGKKRGLIQLEQSNGAWEIAKRSVGNVFRKVKRGSMSGVEGTWYAGSDLKNPGCWQKSHWQPNDNTHVCALQESSNFAACGAFIQLCYKKKCTYCRKVDFCASCKKDHIDMSPGAFKALASLDVGVIEGMTAKTVKQPFSKWTSTQTNMYGPPAL